MSHIHHAAAIARLRARRSRCPQCGHALNKGEKSCRKCGHQSAKSVKSGQSVKPGPQKGSQLPPAQTRGFKGWLIRLMFWRKQ